MDLLPHDTLAHTRLSQLAIYDFPLSSELLMSTLGWQADVLDRALPQWSKLAILSDVQSDHWEAHLLGGHWQRHDSGRSTIVLPVALAPSAVRG